MQQRVRLASACLTLAALTSCAATGGDEHASFRSGDDKPIAAAGASQDEMPLPPGWTEADMQAYMLAGMPGEMHAFLAKGAGVWEGKNTMWMSPGAEPMTCTSVTTVEMLMDGRYASSEVSSEMPGMGSFHGFGLYGYDNVQQKFVSTWIDSMSTGLMNGVGELSEDGKTLTWKFTYHCPITKKPAVIRETERITGENTKTLEMHGVDPKTGVEYQMMRIEFTRKS